MSLFTLSRLAAVVPLLFGAVGAATAAQQTVSNSFFEITYNDATRFGTLSLVGNVISFDLISTANPSQPWIAESLNGVGTNTANGTIPLKLKIKEDAWLNGYRFGAFDWLEGGDYLRKEAGSTVDVQGQIRAVNDALALSTTTTDDLTLLGSGLSTVGANTNWFADARIDTTTPCSGPSCVNVLLSEPREMTLTIENRLSATSAAGLNTQAYIEKKLGAGAFTLVVSPVPEASTWAMLAAGLGMVGFMARRRQQS